MYLAIRKKTIAPYRYTQRSYKCMNDRFIFSDVHELEMPGFGCFQIKPKLRKQLLSTKAGKGTTEKRARVFCHVRGSFFLS